VRRKDLDYAVIAAMFLSGVYVTVSGLVMDVLGLHQFVLHVQAGYVCAALAVVHLALNWGRVMAYLRHRLGRPKRRERPVAPPQAQALSRPGRRAFLVSALTGVGGLILGWLIPRRQAAEPPDESADVGAFYHEWSKPGHAPSLGMGFDWGGQPPRAKTYAGAEHVALPDPHGTWGPSLAEAIEARRSVRDYAAEPLSLEEFSRLLHAAQGVTEPRRGFRAAPSAGALYPLELYAVVNDVTGLEAGIYHYTAQEHALERVQAGDSRTAIMQAGFWQTFLGQAGVCFVLSAVFQRTRWKYRERTYRYVMLEAGHVGQNLYLAATAMGLGACAVGAFNDDELNQVLGLDGDEEAALYIIVVGKV